MNISDQLQKFADSGVIISVISANNQLKINFLPNVSEESKSILCKEISYIKEDIISMWKQSISTEALTSNPIIGIKDGKFELPVPPKIDDIGTDRSRHMLGDKINSEKELLNHYVNLYFEKVIIEEQKFPKIRAARNTFNRIVNQSMKDLGIKMPDAYFQDFKNKLEQSIHARVPKDQYKTYVTIPSPPKKLQEDLDNPRPLLLIT